MFVFQLLRAFALPSQMWTFMRCLCMIPLQLAGCFKEFSVQKPLLVEGSTVVEHVVAVGIGAHR